MEIESSKQRVSQNSIADSNNETPLPAKVVNETRLYESRGGHSSGDPAYIGEANYIRSRIQEAVIRIKDKIYSAKHEIDNIQVCGPVGRLDYEHAIEQPFAPVSLGFELGPDFATYWFKIEATVPPEWHGKQVGLFWDSNSEACVWIDGVSLQGLNPGRNYSKIFDKCRGNEDISLFVEAACNFLLGQSNHPGKPFSDESVRSQFELRKCELRALDAEAWDLYHDFRVLAELEADSVPDNKTQAIGNSNFCIRPALSSAWAGKLRYELNAACNDLDLDDRDTWSAVRKRLAKLLSIKNGDVTHQLSAIGHAHIDTAWLWPIEETYRKTVRTFSSAIRYMNDYPEFRFAVSQAYQYEQIEEKNPHLFAKIKEKVDRDQWVPVGGSYIEPDCNLPSGESLSRQFLFGQQYFESRFGSRCNEFWNPDVFGYNGQLPQILKLAGIDYFLTQKLSWNRFTTPDHHTFYWQAIDGTSVLTHFPPSDTYNGTAAVEELRYQAANYKDADRSSDGLYPFGHGDGGGGPTPQMLETFRRTKNLQGIPRCQIRKPIEFFKLLESQSNSIPTVSGELYFELHRASYTSQAEMKRGLRDGERLLHDIEFLGVVGNSFAKLTYPKSQVDELWKKLLLNQFHDILPGTSISEVHQTAKRDFDWIRQTAGKMRKEIKEGFSSNESASESLCPLNTTGIHRTDVIRLADDDFAIVESPQYGFGKLVTGKDASLEPCEIKEEEQHVILHNAFIEATINKSGELVSLIDRETNRQLLIGPGNRLRLHDDRCSLWDAWDVEPSILETGVDCAPAISCKTIHNSSQRIELQFERKIGLNSTMIQTIRLDSTCRFLEFHCHVEWREKHKLLRVEFPTSVHTNSAAFETAFGTIERPTHTNTAADKAQFETPGHRWADLSEGSYGLTLLTDYKHGFSTNGNTIGLSLLRSPTYPDPECDMGNHQFKYAVMPHSGHWREVHPLEAAIKFTHPIQWTTKPSKIPFGSMVNVTGSSLICDTIKPAEDGNGVILRLYEPYGKSGVSKVAWQLPFENATLCNLLEDNQQELMISEPRAIFIEHQAFQILTIRLSNAQLTS